MTDITFELVDDRDPALYEGPVLYKLDSLGKLRSWRMQLNSLGHYRTLAGLADGKQAESKWTIPVPASQDSVKEQGEFEVRSGYKHQLDREYHISADTVSQPKMIEPMLAKTYDSFPGEGYAQPKLDGIRCIMTAEGMFTRQGQPILAVPHIHAAAAPLFAEYPDLVLDGELYNHDLREDFGEISSIVRKKTPSVEDLEKAEKIMQYHVYDTVDTNSNFFDRHLFLASALSKLDCGWIIEVPTVKCADATEADNWYGHFAALGYEGGMYRLDAPYELGRRSKKLLKRKEFITEEFPCTGLIEGKGNWAGAAKRASLIAKNGQPFGAGIRGKYDTLVQMLKDGVTEDSVATVRYFCLSPDGIPRFPVVIDFHMNGRQD